ncbi:hypothetical protein HKBW3S09_01624 [Candidatus Hakubella thermalkaliphila]|uniref:Uncharacterized protein n=1 Tax=Candidatus Hakubella thermalkaliphila TaxID=2754717 RepID=A0A6V8NV73_9ACTN|nr:hypothetical protein HKBW3S09_01624 [Candidatus Hakubella thermalkaliphila]GFP29211.1 hypothetical protein HKBW3S34_00130 [Candidatus Hakubella thermalkaliphila]GFP42272.1 hypothetical protein HKBW3C_01398 [Candidatus Hakubella thermalkaliphila]
MKNRVGEDVLSFSLENNNTIFMRRGAPRRMGDSFETILRIS